MFAGSKNGSDGYSTLCLALDPTFGSHQCKYTSTDLPLPEDIGTLHPQGSLYVINKIHALHVEDVEDS